MATDPIQQSLLEAKNHGTKQLDDFVEKRICLPPGNDQHVALKAPIHKN